MIEYPVTPGESSGSVSESASESVFKGSIPIPIPTQTPMDSRSYFSLPKKSKARSQ